MDHDVARVAQCITGDVMVGFLHCSVAVIQNVLHSGQVFSKLFVLGKFVAKVTFLKFSKDNW